MSAHFEHTHYDGDNIVLSCDTYGEFIQFMALGRILMERNDVTLDDWAHIAATGKLPEESTESQRARALKDAQTVIDAMLTLARYANDRGMAALIPFLERVLTIEGEKPTAEEWAAIQQKLLQDRARTFPL